MMLTKDMMDISYYQIPTSRGSPGVKMKMRVLSDLHLEFQDWNPPHAEADIIVLAGDIHTGTRGVEWPILTIEVEKPPRRPPIELPPLGDDHAPYAEAA